MTDLGFIHRFIPATQPGKPPLLLLHGTGGDENDLVPLAAQLSPGSALLSPRGKVLDFRIPIQIGKVRVVPGDIVFGDLDGVCVVPQAAEQEIMVAAFDKAHKEKVVRNALEEGLPAKDAFEKYGIL